MIIPPKLIAVAGLLAIINCCSQRSHHRQEDIDEIDLKISLTATANEQAVKEGLRLLRSGGTAMDAAISVALSEIAATGGKHVSFAGIINLVYYEAASRKVYNLNGAFNTLKYEENPLSIGSRDFSANAKLDGRGVLVPGFFRGVSEAHKRFGKLSFETVMENAINIAEDGFVWSSVDSANFAMNKHLLFRDRETKNVFIKADGDYYSPGDVFKQAALSKTLKEISKNGVDYIYKGEWAKKFVKTVNEYGGKISLEDLEEYNVIWSDPAKGYYHDYEIYAHGYPSIGGASLIEALNLAETAELSKKGHYSMSAKALHTLYLICDAAEYYNGTSFQDRLNKELAIEKWNKIVTKQPPRTFEPEKKTRSEHSANVVAVDQWGNMVALIHSINSNVWGSNALFIDGISIPDPAAAWQKEIYEAGPGKRLVENTNPGIILKEGNAVLAFSCIGGGLNNQTLASIISVLDFQMTPEQVVQLPAFGYAYLQNDEAILTIQANKFDKKLLDDAELIGAKFEEHPAAVGGFWSAIFIDPRTKVISSTPVLYE
jgi:gamma-glutamyltranspeptidase/glutathione hydrolase